MVWRVGVDIGGTFTDVALIDDASGEIGVAKVPTTPRDLAEGVLAALRMAMDRYQVKRGDVGLLSHATTVVTNAILEGHGARAALVTTRGFRDILELRRSARGDLYDLFQDAPATLVPRRRRFEITERIGADGGIVTPLAEAEIDALIATLKAQRVEAIAVSLLFSFLNPEHERRLGARLRAAFPGLPIYLSCEVLPEIKEFERTSTTAVCAYVGPILASYLARLEDATRSQGLPPLYVMGSNGGILEAGEAVAMPAMAVEFGPGGRRGGGRAGGAADRARRSPVLRHGRHHRQGQPDPRRPVRDDAGVRGRRRRLEPEPVDARHRPSHPRAGHRSGRGVGGRRVDRLGRPGRLPARRPQERGRRPRARLLRARRHRANRHRLQPPARLSRQGLAARRRPAHRPCGGRSGHCHVPRRAAGRRRALGSRGRHRRRQSRHGGGPQDRLGATGPRPARLRAGGLRRGGAAACRRAGHRARHRGDRLPADPRRLLGAGPHRHRPQARLRAHRLHHYSKRRPRGAGGRLRRAGDGGCRHARPGGRRAGAAALRALRRCALRAPVLRAVHPRSFALTRSGSAGRDRRGVPRSTPRNLRPRQPQRARAARQRPTGRHRRDFAAAHPRQDGTGRHQRRQEQPRGVVPANRGDRRRRLRSPAHAGRAGGARPGHYRVAGVDHPCSTGLAGHDERRRFRSPHALPLSPFFTGRGSG